VSLPVLQPVERRRRRRRRRGATAFWILALAVVAAVAGGFVVGRSHGARADRAVTQTSAAKPAATRTTPARPKPGPRPLLVAAPSAPKHFTPPLTARAAILVDAASGRVLWALRPHLRRHIASTTKIMTALVALPRLLPGDVVTVPRTVLRVPLVKEGLRPEERVRAWKLFYGLLLYSGNDDALTLAVAAAGSRANFVTLMNQEARRLGLRDTHFAGPSGVVDRDNYSSAWDLAALTRVALRDARFRSIVRTRKIRVAWSPPTFAKEYVNKNRLLGSYRGADGVKTGWTTLAGHCLVASAHRGPTRLIAVLLHAADPYRDARRLLDYGFAAAG
jgi:serine-type D-Ala-D-Ala carboxypeptidase (penicillin-binding protein 5/6)